MDANSHITRPLIDEDHNVRLTSAANNIDATPPCLLWRRTIGGLNGHPETAVRHRCSVLCCRSPVPW
jgi:hypothetical protein